MVVILSMICVISFIHLLWFAVTTNGSVDSQVAIMFALSSGILYVAILCRQILSPVLRKRSVAEAWADVCVDTFMGLAQSIRDGVVRRNATSKKNR